MNEVADYLGFNDQSAMQHAFRRWQGMTPGQYRRRMRSMAS
ncbi:MAG: helix-turn-helix domain-containing protein [Halioglobus sp.]